MKEYSIQVFLVDDDEDDYILIRDFLEEPQGTALNLTWVSTYEKALEAILSDDYDVYLLDYRLGDRTGLDLLREAVAKGCTAPMILLTGQGDYEVDIEAMKAGAADYLDKSLISAPLLERSIRYAVERAQAEQKIREQAALLDVATDAILVREFYSNKILFWNKGAERLYGWQAKDAIGKNAEQLLYEDSSPIPSIQEILLETGEWQGEVRQLTKDGKEVIIEGRWTLVLDSQDQPKAILTVNTDITEKKQLESQFLRAQRLESIGTLAGGVAHDLNNILSPILMTTQLLRMRNQDPQNVRWLDTIETSAKRGAELVKQVLSFSRGLKGEKTILQIGHIMGEIKQIIQGTFPKDIKIKTDFSARELWTLQGNATQIQQVLMNLCVNARDAMPEGGTLFMGAKNVTVTSDLARRYVQVKEGNYVVVKVADTGTGIPPEVLDRMYDPFFTTKDIGKGTGLGLSTVIGIVKSHGGFIDVNSKVGQGTAFRVYFPATGVPTQKQEARQYQDLPKGRGELILVVDDEATIREATKNSLEHHAYKVLLASNGAEAIALYTRHHDQIQAVLMDMMMPFLDGSKTIQALQRINPQINIIAVSGLETNEEVAKSAGMSVKRFLAKPFTTEQLLINLQKVLNS